MELFAEMVREGCTYAVMEVSSHALELHRVDGCRYLIGAFTNLTPGPSGFSRHDGAVQAGEEQIV